jgi:hypothetical protein
MVAMRVIFKDILRLDIIIGDLQLNLIIDSTLMQEVEQDSMGKLRVQ